MPRYKQFVRMIFPLIFLAIIMNVIRGSLFSSHSSYLYMNWNLFLALLPLFFSFLYKKQNSIIVRGIFFFLWFLFLPNAIYMLTDFIHLREVGLQTSLWYDAMMLFLYALVGVWVNAFSILQMAKQIFKTRMGKNVFLFLISFFVSFGVYLGRYLRFNSWDFFTKPTELVSHSFQIILRGGKSPLVLTIIFFSSFILITIEFFSRVFSHEDREHNTKG